MIKRILPIAAFLAVLATQAFTQGTESDPSTGQGGDVVFAPYPSKLRVGIKGETIVLTWVDSDDAKGPCVIYRSSAEILESSLGSAAALGEVAYGQVSFTDSPPSDGTYFYAVLSRDEKGELYRVLVPLKNKTIVGIPFKRVATTAPKPSPLALSASIGDGIIDLSYTPVDPSRKLVLFRSTSPINDPKQLSSATIVSVFNAKEGKAADYPVPGIDYYYALVDEASIRDGSLEIIPGKNATVTAVQLPLGGAQLGLPELSSVRGLPLPLMAPATSQGTGDAGIPQRQELDSPTEKAYTAIASRYIPSAAKEIGIHILPGDLDSPATSEAYTLKSILEGYLLKGDYQESANQLEKFLSLRRSEPIGMKAKYYLGLCYAKIGKYKESFFALLQVSDISYVEIQGILTWLLSRMRDMGL